MGQRAPATPWTSARAPRGAGPGRPHRRGGNRPRRGRRGGEGDGASSCARCAGRRLAFAGIASPEAFSRTLDTLRVEVADFATFADHHWYTAGDLAALEARAVAFFFNDTATTEKDW